MQNKYKNFIWFAPAVVVVEERKSEKERESEREGIFSSTTTLKVCFLLILFSWKNEIEEPGIEFKFYQISIMFSLFRWI